MIMRLSEVRYDNPAYRDIKNSIDTAKEEGREEGRVEGIAKEKLATAKNVFSAWGSHKSKLPKVQTFQ
ncbi:hypothetical protein DW064_10350 [Segatella copri]|uniref:Uncharacterized protein n=1 Tax=Segatella copri TaxID=165179 RepID=A0AA92V4F3_9BACT|nr:hypothetical protein DW064_10350 [Segatella copri]